MLPLLALAASSFAVGSPAFDPRQHKGEIAGAPAQVLVLGTMHLSQLPERLDTRLLEPLLNRLAAYNPEVITVEGLGGEECDTLGRFKPEHDKAYKTYCFDTAELEKMTGLDIPAAEAEADRALASWPANPAPEQRRHLAMLFLAAGNLASATVQWLRLSEAERHAGDGLTDAMINLILRKGRPPNENYAIGAALAARLGLERVYPIDDHLADGPDQGEDSSKAVQAAWNKGGEPRVKTEYKRLAASLHSAADVLAFYRFLNEPGTERATIASDMGRAALDPSPQQYGRQYLSWWEGRNLRMVGNIRSAFSSKPDARVLVIVGATHKGYLDAYLNMMQDVRLIDAEKLLR